MRRTAAAPLSISIAAIAFDCRDAATVAAFWSAAFDIPLDSEPTRQAETSYAVFCLKKKTPPPPPPTTPFSLTSYIAHHTVTPCLLSV